MATRTIARYLSGIPSASESDNLNKAIAELVSRGLPVQVQQALDIVRVTGNNAVHPGTIDVDDEGVASSLFDLVNLITETMISQPKQIQAMYQSLPQGARDAIDERDSQPPT